MIVIAGGDLLLEDRIVTGGSLLVEDGLIVGIDARRVAPGGATVIDAEGCYVSPGFIDVHVHGVEGHDTLDAGNPVAQIAARMPRYGVTAFCPTTVACAPDVLRGFLDQVRRGRFSAAFGAARVLPAHLESNFINPDYRGAQPLTCLRAPSSERVNGSFSGRDVLAEIALAGSEVGIITVAPEVPGGIDLVQSLTAAGHRVSLGHSGADFDTGIAAIEAGARHATHLFNRMTPLGHRAPGLAAAVLTRDEVAAELICDGFHVHPAMCDLALRTKSARRVMAITDGTAGSGLPPGSVAHLGGRTIRVRDGAAFLDEGTLAGSTLTMDRAFANIAGPFGRSVVEAALMCATTPARELGLEGLGSLAEGAIADIVMLDRDFRVARTFVDGEQVWARD